jgi:hypothetical protein
MDSDDEKEQMFVELFEKEMATTAQDEEHMLILARLSGLYAEKAIDQILAKICQIRRTVSLFVKNKVKYADHRTPSWGDGWKFCVPHTKLLSNSILHSEFSRGERQRLKVWRCS